MKSAWGILLLLAACGQTSRTQPGKDRDLGGFLEEPDAGGQPDMVSRDLAGVDLAGAPKSDLATAPKSDMAGSLPVADMAQRPGDMARAPGSDPLIYVNEAATLYTVDPDTFELTTIGSFGVADDITDIAVRADDTLIGITRTGIYSVSTSNGAATVIVENAFTEMTALTFLSDDRLLSADVDGNVYQLSWSGRGASIMANIGTLGSYGGGMTTAGDLTCIDDGTLWGLTNGGVATDANNALMIVNNTNGHGTVTGSVGYGTLWGSAYSRGRILAFSSTGQVVSIDTNSGVGTLVKTHAGKSFYGAATNPTALPSP